MESGAKGCEVLADLNNSPCFSRILVHGVDGTMLRLGKLVESYGYIYSVIIGDRSNVMIIISSC